MQKNISILSTKMLTAAQKELLLNAGVSLLEYNAIEIDLSEDLCSHETVDHAIFTSKNAVKVLLHSTVNLQHCYCVGTKTQKLLTTHGYTVVEVGTDATDLAQKIIQNHQDKTFVFFCGNQRREELPTLLKKHHIIFKEQIVYDTHQVHKKFDRIFDGVLFFSPSAVQSYSTSNTLENSIAFCIGNTTASEAKKHTKHVVAANTATIENVIVQVVKHFRT